MDQNGNVYVGTFDLESSDDEGVFTPQNNHEASAGMNGRISESHDNKEALGFAAAGAFPARSWDGPPFAKTFNRLARYGEPGYMSLDEEIRLSIIEMQKLESKGEGPVGALNKGASGKGPQTSLQPDTALPGSCVKKRQEYVDMRAPTKEVQEVVDELDDNDHGDTYDEYSPSKLKIGHRHPDPVVESSSLSVIQPPDIVYELHLPREVIETPLLSALQLESVVYACQKHESTLPDGTRAGYLVGDGPGVGKGRIIAGLVYENMICMRTKALWLSVSNDLKFDAIRDLEDINCNVQVYSLGKVPYCDKIEEYFDEYNDVGVLFSTYSSLIGESQTGGSLYHNRLEQIVEWLTPGFSGLIIFDECHKAKNLMPTSSSKPTKTALAVLKLQNSLPDARVVYCSATGASEPRNMAYMVRLGLWGLGTPNPDFMSFLSAVEKRGVGGMELVAMDMKLRGMYLARQLSFHGVSFAVKEISLTPTFRSMYDESVKWWDKAHDYFDRAADLCGYSSREKSVMLAQFFSSHQRFFKCLCIASKVNEVEAMVQAALQDNKAVVIGLQSTGESKAAEYAKEGAMDKIISTAWGILVSLLDRHFPCSYDQTFKDVRKYGGAGDVVCNEDDSSADDSIGRCSSSDDGSLGFSRKRRVVSNGVVNDNGIDQLRGGNRLRKNPSDATDKLPPFGSVVHENPFLLTAGLSADKFNFLPSGAPSASVTPSFVTSVNKPDSANSISKCEDMLAELKKDTKELGPKLPPNTLDELIDRFGGPSRVSEMTGRKCRIVKEYNSSRYVYQSRNSDDCPIEMVNIREKDDFMNGKKFVAIISEAASAGISLQSDKRVRNQRKRLHITLELSWSADRAIQQFGRTHRSNQMHPPEYLFVISELAGEKRFAFVVAKRLESLGALTHGDRRATHSGDLSQFNIDNKYGRYALEYMVETLHGRNQKVVDYPPYEGDFVQESCVAIGRMLNIGSLKKPDKPKDKDSKESVKIHKFLNRLLGIKVGLQNALYQFYMATLDYFVAEAKRNGKYDYGIIDWGIGGEKVVEVSRFQLSCPTVSGILQADLFGVSIERGMSYDDALNRRLSSCDTNDGFYISRESKGRARQVALVLSTASSSKDSEEKVYTLCRPNTGFGVKKESIDSVLKNYCQVGDSQAREEWESHYKASESMCIHKYWWGKCKSADAGHSCEIGKRGRMVYLFCGGIFSLWNIIERVFGSTPIRIARISISNGVRRIGILVPYHLVSRLVDSYGQPPSLAMSGRTC